MAHRLPFALFEEVFAKLLKFIVDQLQLLFGCKIQFHGLYKQKRSKSSSKYTILQAENLLHHEAIICLLGIRHV